MSKPAMKLRFLGATGTVTGSKYLVEHGGSRVLVDCGLFQGYKQLRLRNREPLPVEPAALDAVVLTHAHLDHSGYLPLLVKNGFRGHVYCTAATRDLCGILLPDSGRLLEEEAEYANRHGFSKHSPARPLYTEDDAMACLERLRPVPWSRRVDVASGMSATLVPAGHMPGAAQVRLEVGGEALLFSGDLGRPHDLLLRAPAPLQQCDHLVLESTYGNRLHPTTDVLDELGAVINRTSARGGTLVIPAFAIGRAQALLHAIALLKARRAIHQLPVYLNSPMASSAMVVYHRHADELRISRAECEAIARSATLVSSADESRELNARRGPMIIIAGSGMATGGRVVHHLKAFAPDHRNTVLLVGYQAGGTRGASLAAGASAVRIHGQDIPVRAEVARIDSMSAHADAQEIEDWLRVCSQAPAQTFLTHGEPDAADALRQRIEHSLRWPVRVPEYLESARLGGDAA